MTKVLIIGGVAAGSKAAAKLKRLRPDFEIIIYTQEKYVSYSACGMPYYIANTVRDLEKLIIRTVDEFEESGISVKNLHYVQKILPETKQLFIKNLKTGETFYDNYDKLLIATGAETYVPHIKNYNLENVFCLRALKDSKNIKNRLKQCEKATIVGGNYIGVELLESFIRQNVTTSVVEAENTLMKFFDFDMGQIITDDIKKMHPDISKIYTGDIVTELEEIDDEIQVSTRNGLKFLTDMVVLATGIRPCVRLAKDAGIELGIAGSIKVNNRMQTSIPDIWAAGDCVEKFNIVSKKNVWVPLGSTANKEGRVAAFSMAGIEDEIFDGILGSLVLKYFDYTVSLTGLTEIQAKESGFNVVTTTITKYDKSYYMPSANKITLKMIADSDSQRILGAQVIGLGDADKRINTLTAIIQSEYKLKEIINHDITYSPPLSSSIDPIITAAQILIDKLNN